MGDGAVEIMISLTYYQRSCRDTSTNEDTFINLFY